MSACAMCVHVFCVRQFVCCMCIVIPRPMCVHVSTSKPIYRLK